MNAVQRAKLKGRRGVGAAAGSWILILAFIAASGCTDADRAAVPRAVGNDALKAPAAPIEHTFAGVSSFDVAESEGTVHVLFARPAGPESKDIPLFHIRSDDGGATWSEPARVATGHAPPPRLHRGDDPQIAAHGDMLMALWTARGDGPFGSGPLATALSDDGGRTWRAGPSPAARPLPVQEQPAVVIPTAAPASPGAKKPHAAKGTGPGYRFPATTGDRDGFHVVWIHAIGDERSLRHARLAPGTSAWSDPTVVDPKICACCWNELKPGPGGSLLALYRDQHPSDMMLARSRDAGRTWEQPTRVGGFDWHFEGCPHVGGGVAVAQDARGGNILTTVWTGKPQAAGAYLVATSPRGAATPVPLSAEPGAGRNTDVAILADGTAMAVWDQSAEGGQAVYAKTSSDGADWLPAARLSPAGQNAAYPRVVATARRFVVLWTVYGPDGSLTMQTRSTAVSQ